VSREVHTIRAAVKDASGGPLIDRDGKMLGVSFGTAVDDANTGAALTARRLRHSWLISRTPRRVATGREQC
jgi:hypothetical protein